MGMMMGRMMGMMRMQQQKQEAVQTGPDHQRRHQNQADADESAMSAQSNHRGGAYVMLGRDSSAQHTRDLPRPRPSVAPKLLPSRPSMYKPRSHPYAQGKAE